MKNLVSLVRSFCVHRSGNIVIPFALTFGFVVLVIGAGLDYSRAHNTKVVLQAAVDATALAANYDSEGLAEAKVKANAVDYFNAIYKGDPEAVELDVTVEKGTVTVSATQAVQTLFGGMLNVDKVDVGVRSQTVIGKATFDVVMVLDNSGSMGGSKMRTLKEASEDLAKTLFAINEKGDKKDRVKIGLVPFTSFVNVGKDKANAAWMDTQGRSPIHWTNFQTRPDGTPDPAEFDNGDLAGGKPSRFTLFKQLKRTDWLGCVEARPMPYDVTDAVPTNSDPATLFVPEFAPDEPDSKNRRYGDSYYNNYLNDDKGACSDKVKNVYQSSGMDRWEYAQKRLCKYRNQPKNYGNNWNKGPNYWCKTQPITDLTENKSKVVAAIKNMVADGHTNIHQGAVWGWRVLSPRIPFTEGREPEEDSDDEHVRILIVMTDGANTYQGQNSFNKTRINAYGYGAEERLGRGVDSSWEIERKMDDRTALTCENAKNDGVRVYTVAFQINDRNTVDMMRNCATNANMAFDARSNGDLIDAFKRIADEISKLRLNK